MSTKMSLQPRQTYYLPQSNDGRQCVRGPLLEVFVRQDGVAETFRHFGYEPDDVRQNRQADET